MSHNHDDDKEKSCGCNHEHCVVNREKHDKKCDENHKEPDCEKHEESCSCHGGHHAHHEHHEHHERDHCGCGCDHDHEHDSCGCGCDHEHEERLSLQTLLLYGVGAVLLLVAFLGEFSVISQWIAIPAAILVYAYFGKEAWMGAISGIRRKKFFTEFTLMCVATIGAAALLEFADAAAVMYLYSLGEVIQGAAYRKSRDNISELIEITEEYINKEENGSIRRVAASEAKIGDIINVTVGEKISLDGVVVEGNGFADTAAVTGESVPRELLPGTGCLSGSVLVAGAVSIRATEVYENSTANKLKAAVERAVKQKAQTEKKITKFAALFTPCAFAAALVLFIIGCFAWGDVPRALRTALVVLVVSCPCSLVLSVPLAYFSGIGKAAGRGIVFRGGEVIDNASALGTIVFDKTGTLTSATLDFDGVWLPADAPLTKAQLLDVSRYALAKSPHAAAHSFCAAYEAKVPHRVEKVNNIGGKGLVCTVDGYRAAFGNRALMEEQGVTVKQIRGTAIYVALEGKLCGALLFRSKIKPETLPEIAKLRGNRVERIAIMSGDTETAVSEVSDELGVSEYYAELKPDEKLEKLDNIYNEEKKRNKKRTVAFCGDGLNDSAVIARADVGIAMGSGSAVTVESADVVIVDDSIARINDMLSIAKSTTRVANQNIVISLGIKLVVALIGILAEEPSLELAVIADVGAAIVTVLNATRAGNIR